jgi:hypothetical protein
MRRTRNEQGDEEKKTGRTCERTSGEARPKQAREMKRRDVPHDVANEDGEGKRRKRNDVCACAICTLVVAV